MIDRAGRIRPQVALLVAAALLLVPWLGLTPLFDVDEGAFGEATREMLASGDWLSTTLNGAPRFDKPILIYWLQAASAAVFGLGEFALRLPSALAALAWIAAIGRFASERLDGNGVGFDPVALAVERRLDDEFEKAGQAERIAKNGAFEHPAEHAAYLIGRRCFRRRLEACFPRCRVRLHSQVALLKRLAADAPRAIPTSAFPS